MTSTNDSTQGLVLVIDEDASTLISFSRHLEACGYEVMTARDGFTAIQLIAVHPPDLILADLRIPAMEGTPFFRYLQKRCPEIPVIVSASSADAAEVVACIRKGARDFLVKPLKEMAPLSQAVANAIRESRLTQLNLEYKEFLEKTFPESAKELETANRHLTEQNRRLKEVMLSSRRLTSCDTIEGFGARLLQELSHQLDASGGSLYLAGREGLRLIHCLDSGHAPSLISYPVKKDSPFGMALHRKEPILIGDIHHTRALRPSGYDGYRSGSFMIFPLQNPEGKPFGLVSLHEKKRPPFIKQDREMGALLATYSSETLRSMRDMRALARNKEKYRLAALTASDVISEWNPATGELAWFGNIDAAIGSAPGNRPTTMEAWLSLIHPDDRQRVATTYRNNLSCATAPPMDYRVRHRAHGWRHFRERTTTLRARGEAAKVLRAVNDITPVKNTQEARSNAELKIRYEQKLKNLGMITGGLAHDVNNSLMAVLGQADIALMAAGENPAVKKNLNSIIAAGRRATELTQQLLLYSGQSETEPRAININRLISEVIRHLTVSVPQKIRITFDPGRHAPTFMGIPNRLRLLVLNLLTNASQAIGNASGRIVIKTGTAFYSKDDLAASAMPVRPDLNASLPETTYTFIDIEDTGCGMDESDREKLFSPFPSSHTKRTALGLGMAAVQAIIRQHHGTMTIHSTPGAGTQIRVLFPPLPGAAKARQVPAAAPAETIPQHVGGLILIADDEEPIRNISQSMLEKLGFSVVTASNGKEAVALYETLQNDISCVILDMNMPGLSGHETLARIRKINPSVKAIFASGYSPSRFLTNHPSDAHCPYLQKPYQITALHQALREILKYQEPAATKSPLDKTVP